MDKEKIKTAIKMIIEEIDNNPNRPDLERTPERVAKMFEDIFSGSFEAPEESLHVLLAEQHDEIVIVRDIPIYSMCEHHMLPFFGKAHIGYIPKNNRITGLSKLARVAEVFAKRLQVQERLTASIADLIMKKLKPYGVKKARLLYNHKRRSRYVQAEREDEGRGTLPHNVSETVLNVRSPQSVLFPAYDSTKTPSVYYFPVCLLTSHLVRLSEQLDSHWQL